jgi:hypothetical protein
MEEGGRGDGRVNGGRKRARAGFGSLEQDDEVSSRYPAYEAMSDKRGTESKNVGKSVEYDGQGASETKPSWTAARPSGPLPPPLCPPRNLIQRDFSFDIRLPES